MATSRCENNPRCGAGSDGSSGSDGSVGSAGCGSDGSSGSDGSGPWQLINDELRLNL